MATAEHNKQEQYPLLKPNGPFVITAGNLQEAPGTQEMPTSSRCYFPRRWILMLLISLGGARMLSRQTAIQIHGTLC